MIKVDLITGFLGSGKTTFIKKYAQYFMDKGIRVGILENDYGAVNVDMLLLQDMRGEKCELEMVAGGCGADCHKRRFKTKLISMAMSGYGRVIIEPSGIFDMDEFFDTLREDPLENWYEIGNVITVVDAKADQNMSKEAEFIFASQLADAGCIIMSKTDLASKEDILRTSQRIKSISEELGCRRPLEELICTTNWDDMSEEERASVVASGYQKTDYVKKLNINDAGYSTLYYLEHGLNLSQIKGKVKELFSKEKFGDIFRIKGFFMDQNKWYELNATRSELTIDPIKVGQDVLIVIGHDINKNLIDDFMQQ